MPSPAVDFNAPLLVSGAALFTYAPFSPDADGIEGRPGFVFISPKLRRTINAATNKSEEFNDFVKWLFFGGEGIIAENIRHEQRKVVKYNQLVANMVILHNVQGMTRVLKDLQAKGFPLTEELLRGTAPYRREHINRFGEYPLDLDRPMLPMNYKLDFTL